MSVHGDADYWWGPGTEKATCRLHWCTHHAGIPIRPALRFSMIYLLS